MPRPRHADNVAPPQRVAKSVPMGNRTHPAETTRPSASATKIARPAGPAASSCSGRRVPAFAAVAPSPALELAYPLEISRWPTSRSTRPGERQCRPRAQPSRRSRPSSSSATNSAAARRSSRKGDGRGCGIPLNGSSRWATGRLARGSACSCLAQLPEIAVLDPPVITGPKGADDGALALDGYHPWGEAQVRAPAAARRRGRAVYSSHLPRL